MSSTVKLITSAYKQLEKNGKISRSTALRIVSKGKKNIVIHDSMVWNESFKIYKNYCKNPKHQKHIVECRIRQIELMEKYGNPYAKKIAGRLKKKYNL